jgi:hypothetical protein
VPPHDQALKRPRDPFQLAKLIGDIATGQIEDQAKNKPRQMKRRKAKRRSKKP